MADITRDEFNKAILDRHNEFRAKVAQGGGLVGNEPAAKNMNKLQHSCVLEAIAQDWADHLCASRTFDHRTNADIKETIKRLMTPELQEKTFAVAEDGNTQGGENLAAGGGSTLEGLVSRVDAWVAEHSDFTFVEGAEGTKVAGKMTGHYTAVAWADTRFVGCGFSICPNGEYKEYVVCNYFKAGNMAGSAPYLGGTECTQCPADRGTSCGTGKFKGLCDGCMSKDWFSGSTTKATCNATEQENKALGCGVVGGDLPAVLSSFSGSRVNRISSGVIPGIVFGVLFGNQSSISWMLVLLFVCTVFFGTNL